MIIELFNAGGPLFMGLLSILALLSISLLFKYSKTLFGATPEGADQVISHKKWLHQLAVLAIMVGVLGQLLGLYQAFGFIQEMKEISPTMLMGGLKVSMISTLYGLIIAISVYLTVLILDFVHKRA